MKHRSLGLTDNFTRGIDFQHRSGLLRCENRLLDRTVERVEWTVPKLKADLAAAPNDPPLKYRAVFAQGKGVAWDKARTYYTGRQIETTIVAQWIERHLR